jgi:thioester reductase-like protein
MIDFALGSPRSMPPRLLFTSSIGIVQWLFNHNVIMQHLHIYIILLAWSNIPPAPEDAITDLSIISMSGYSESKWVSERILFTARQQMVLLPVIICVGQLCSGMNGNWNTREWFPALARASQIVKGVPDNEGVSFT